MTGREFRDNALHAEKILREESKVSNQEADHLVRFRADPSKVRVSVRPNKGQYSAYVAGFIKDMHYSCKATDNDPEKAVADALRHAEDAGMSGIDLGMGNAYPHPMKVAQ